MKLCVVERAKCGLSNSWRHIWPNTCLQLLESKQIILQPAPQAHQGRARDPLDSPREPQRLHQVHPATCPHRQRSKCSIHLGEQDRCVVQLRGQQVCRHFRSLSR